MALEEALSLLGEFVKGDSGKRTVFVNVMRKTYRPGYMVPEAHPRRWARQLKVPMRKLDEWMADFLRETPRYRAVGARKMPKIRSGKAIDGELARDTIKVEPKVAKSLQELSRASSNAVRSLIQSGNTRRQRERRRTEGDVDNFLAANFRRALNNKNGGTAFNGKVDKRRRDG